MSVTTPIERLGRATLDGLAELGAVLMLALRCARAAITRRMEWREALRQANHFGVGSLLVLASTAAMVGGIIVIQAGLYVGRFGVQELVGWFVGFGVLREVGPLIAGLVFSGRVGSRNAAEIAAMATRDQLEGLRSIGIDVVPVVIAPRAAAMAFSLMALYFVGSVISIATAAGVSDLLIGVDIPQFRRSFFARTEMSDLWTGMMKSLAFSIAVALISCRAGLAARGGATAVGDAAKRAVVRGAFAIVALDLCVARLMS